MDYLNFLPEPPEECRDPDLFRMLNEFHFVRWHPDYAARKDELKRDLSSASILERAKVGTSDPSDRLRLYSGQLLISARRAEAMPSVLNFLADLSEEVRGGIADCYFMYGMRVVWNRSESWRKTSVPLRSRPCSDGTGRAGPALHNSPAARTAGLGPRTRWFRSHACR
jgi:hypothetical protein